MKRYLWFFIPALLWARTDAHAQITSEISSMPEKWQLSLDVIKTRAQALLIKNSAIHSAYQQLAGQQQELQQSLKSVQEKNEATRDFLSKRQNRTDQQMRLEALKEAIEAKKEQGILRNKQMDNMKLKKSDLERKIHLQKLKITQINLQQEEQQRDNGSLPGTAIFTSEDQLMELRKRLEDEKKQEVLLEDQLVALKAGGRAQRLEAEALDKENKDLQEHLRYLQDKAVLRQTQGTDKPASFAKEQKYAELKKRKESLEVDISAYQMRIEQLKEASLSPLPWPVQKRKLVHKMVQIDAQNNQWRAKINMLKEDVDILKSQVAKLERKANFIQGKDKI